MRFYEHGFGQSAEVKSLREGLGMDRTQPGTKGLASENGSSRSDSSRCASLPGVPPGRSQHTAAKRLRVVPGTALSGKRRGKLALRLEKAEDSRRAPSYRRYRTGRRPPATNHHRKQTARRRIAWFRRLCSAPRSLGQREISHRSIDLAWGLLSGGSRRISPRAAVGGFQSRVAVRNRCRQRLGRRPLEDRGDRQRVRSTLSRYKTRPGNGHLRDQTFATRLQSGCLAGKDSRSLRFLWRSAAFRSQKLIFSAVHRNNNMILTTSDPGSFWC